MDDSRAGNTDNGKHSPSGNYNKASASDPAFWPTSMGAWDAPGRVIVTENSEGDEDGDDSYISEQGVGTQAYNPDPMYKPSDFNSQKK